MPKRSSKAPKASKRAKVTKLPKRERDVNQLASAVLRRTLQLSEDAPQKDPIAVELGRRGGLKGGRVRMDSMTKEERRQLAAKAARARWGSVKRKRDRPLG